MLTSHRVVALLVGLALGVASVTPCPARLEAMRSWIGSQREGAPEAAAPGHGLPDDEVHAGAQGHVDPFAPFIVAACPCGCGEHGASTVGSLGVALLPAAPSLAIRQSTAIPLDAAVQALRAAPTRIEHVPLA